MLLTLAALALAVLAPTFHYHQFGDPTRMARDAGFSALLMCGGVLAVFGTIRSFRREIESGTLEMALAHPVSRTGCFLAKAAGAFAAYLAFAVVTFGATLVMYEGAAVGGDLARQTGDIARIYAPCLGCGVGLAILPLAAGALLNRFAHFRFVLTAFALAVFLAVLCVGGVAFLRGRDVARLLPVAVAIVLFTSVLQAAAAAFSVRLRANAAASAVGVLFALAVPCAGNYYLVDALGGGGSLSWGYVGLAAAVTAPALVAFLLLGVHFINGRDIQWTL